MGIVLERFWFSSDVVPMYFIGLYFAPKKYQDLYLDYDAFMWMKFLTNQESLAIIKIVSIILEETLN